MSFVPKNLLEVLPQTNKQGQLDKQWQEYYQFYGCAELLDDYHLHIGCLRHNNQATVYQHFKQPITNSSAAHKGTCVIVHGYMDHSALYRHLIKHQLSQGWDVLIYDKIGHGLSSGTKYAINDFIDYADQLEQILQYLLGLQSVENSDSNSSKVDNWLLIGQSTGSAVIMEHALNSKMTDFQQIKQRILLAPLVRSRQFFKVKVMYQLLRFFVEQVKRGVSKNSHDQAFLSFIYDQDPFTVNKMRVNWVGAMLKWEKRFLSQSKLSAPVLVIQGDNDDTVDWRFNLKAIKQQFPNSQQFIIAGGKHHLVNEGLQWRSQVFKLIDKNIIS